MRAELDRFILDTDRRELIWGGQIARLAPAFPLQQIRLPTVLRAIRPATTAESLG